MIWYEIILKYWTQIAVLFAVIGYLVKVILDHSFKRKEITYSVFAKVRLDMLNTFFDTKSKIWQTSRNLQSEMMIGLSFSDAQPSLTVLVEEIYLMMHLKTKLNLYTTETEQRLINDIFSNFFKLWGHLSVMVRPSGPYEHAELVEFKDENEEIYKEIDRLESALVSKLQKSYMVQPIKFFGLGRLAKKT